MKSVTTSAKGQVVIPKAVREKVGLKPGGRALVEAVGDHVEIRAVPEDPVEFFCGAFKAGTSLTRPLLKARKEDVRRETKKRA